MTGCEIVKICFIRIISSVNKLAAAAASVWMACAPTLKDEGAARDGGDHRSEGDDIVCFVQPTVECVDGGNVITENEIGVCARIAEFEGRRVRAVLSFETPDGGRAMRGFTVEVQPDSYFCLGWARLGADLPESMRLDAEYCEPAPDGGEVCATATYNVNLSDCSTGLAGSPSCGLCPADSFHSAEDLRRDGGWR